MTTGNVVVGTDPGPFYYRRIWNGADGIVHEQPTPIKYYRYRLISQDAPRFYVRTIGFDANGKRIKVMRYTLGKKHFTVEEVTRMRHHRPSRGTGRPVDHAYTCNYRIARAVKGTHPTYGTFLSNSPVWESFPAWTNNSEIALLSKLSDRVKGHAFNLGVALGEGAETTQLILGTISRFTRAIRSLKQGRIDHALRHLGAAPQRHHMGRGAVRPRPLRLTDVSSLWLEIQYGWRPLLRDVHEASMAYSAITDRSRIQKWTARYVGYREEKTYFPWAWHKQYRVRVQSKQIVYTAKEYLSEVRSLGLCNPASVAWELVPFSFVADWFIPIGSYLDVLCTAPKLVGYFVVTLKETTRGSADGYNDISYNGAHTEASQCIITRTVPSSLSVPYPEFISPREALSVGRIKNAIALLHQQVMHM